MPRGAAEIERKWLVKESPDLSRHKRVEIIQGYLAAGVDGVEVRLRRMDDKFFETVKTGAGLQRGEIEIEISKKQFRKLWPATQGKRLEKVRYTLKWHGKNLELDLYQKKLSGLMVAEVEFKTRKHAEEFSPPPWFGKEVTEDEAYQNAKLAA